MGVTYFYVSGCHVAELTDRAPKVDNFSGGHHMATIGSSISRLVGRHLNHRLRKLSSFVGRLSPVPLQEFRVRAGAPPVRAASALWIDERNAHQATSFNARLLALQRMHVPVIVFCR
jgi:hypothetical protein